MSSTLIQQDPILELARIFREENNIVFFGGAGTSTESLIPDFRSKDGLYSTQFFGYEPEYLLSHDCLMRQSELFYDYLRTKLNFPDAQPNRGHKVLAKLEEKGLLNGVITQNIDGLHQSAGSKNVMELHGTLSRSKCTKCGIDYPGSFLYDESSAIPKCPACSAMIRPEVTLYGEMLDNDVIEQAIHALSLAKVLIVGGTSLAVYPAAGFLEYFRGDTLILMNRDVTPLDKKASFIIRESIGASLARAYELAFGETID